MKTRNTLVSLAVLLTAITGWSKSKNGTATASGQCSIAISGDNNTVPSAKELAGACGVPQEQLTQIVKLINIVLAKKDSAQIKAKLDELRAIALKPTPAQYFTQSNVFEGTNNGTVTQEVNQYGAPKLSVTDDWVPTIAAAMKDYATKKVFVSAELPPTPDSWTFTQNLTRALQEASMDVTGPRQAASANATVPPGLSYWVGDNRLVEIKTLNHALFLAHLVASDDPVIAVRLSDPEGLMINIAPNR